MGQVRIDVTSSPKVAIAASRFRAFSMDTRCPNPSPARIESAFIADHVEVDPATGTFDVRSGFQNDVKVPALRYLRVVDDPSLRTPARHSSTGPSSATAATIQSLHRGS